MQTNITLQDLATELQRREATKRDLKCPSPLMQMNEGNLVINNERFELTQVGRKQLAQRVGIPVPYFERMWKTSQHKLIDLQVNYWLNTEPATLTVRTLDGKARAILGSAYLPIDHYDLVNVAFPNLQELNMQVTALTLTENKFYLQAVTSKLEGEVKPGDVVQGGICISNSEIGLGSVALEEFYMRLVCVNGMVMKDFFRCKHVTRRASIEEISYQQDTMNADAQALLLTFRDTVSHVLNKANFDKRLATMQSAADRQATKLISEISEVTRKAYSLGSDETDNFITNLARGGDMSQWGIANALTATAKSVGPDRAYELEKAGADVLEMTPNKFGIFQAH